jgi:GNAT superfamily N-acetyltransferase
MPNLTVLIGSSKRRSPAASPNSRQGWTGQQTASGGRCAAARSSAPSPSTARISGLGIGYLRWFIMDDAVRGLSIWRRLLSEAVAFCDHQKFGHVDLWTLRGPDAARKLYEDFGFTLAEELVGYQWVREITEQRFRRLARS